MTSTPMRPIVLLSVCAILAAIASSQEGLTDADLTPEGPATSIKSTYPLRQELATWTPIALFWYLVDSRRLLPFDRADYVVLAPTISAFIRLLLRLGVDETPLTGTPQDVAASMESLIGPDVLDEILRYHIIPGGFTEAQLAARGKVTTVQGGQIDFSGLRALNDVDGPSGLIDESGDTVVTSKRRIYRPIEVSNGNLTSRLMIIDSVLLPFNLSGVLEGTGTVDNRYIDVSAFSQIESQIPPAARTVPYLSLPGFVSARTDLAILNALFLIYGQQLSSALGTGTGHFFAPTDAAFLELVRGLLGENVDIDSENPAAGVIEAGAAMLNVLRGINGLPSLPEVLLYHIANTTASYESLVGEGSPETYYPNSTLSVTEEGVVDNDSARGPARRIGSFPILNGWVTVIDSVLLPFDSGIAKAVVDASVNATAARNCPESEDESSCFAGDASVKLSDGRRVKMADVQAGDEVTVDRDGKTSKIYLFSHRSPQLARFVEVETETGRSLRLTRGHYLYANGRLLSAGSVRIGDVVETESGMEKVVRLGSVVRRGIFAPHSVHGDMMVDGVRVSAYTTAVAPRLAHAILAPVRAAAVWGGVQEPLGSLLYGGVGERWLRSVAWIFGGSESY